MTDQTKWRFCAKCHVMFYNGFDPRGSCPHDGAAHAPQGLNFQLPFGGPETDHAQRNWRFCRKCFAMHWAGATTQVCNMGGQHDPTGSFDFSLPHDLPETANAQSNWRFCEKCSNLFWPRPRIAVARLAAPIPLRVGSSLCRTGPTTSTTAGRSRRTCRSAAGPSRRAAKRRLDVLDPCPRQRP